MTVAFFVAAGVVGPTIGYVMGGYLLSLYTDFITLSQDEYVPPLLSPSSRPPPHVSHSLSPLPVAPSLSASTVSSLALSLFVCLSLSPSLRHYLSVGLSICWSILYHYKSLLGLAGVITVFCLDINNMNG